MINVTASVLFPVERAVVPFEADGRGTPGESVSVIAPLHRVALDDWGGSWVVAADVDGDGELELISAQNHDFNDTHYTTTAVAQKLDGRVLWRWGDPAAGRRELHHDVGCQVYDWDGDGRPEVILLDRDAIVELDGVTGEERRRLPIPVGATDCLVFANLSGGDRATDVIVKDRYRRAWAFDRSGRERWHVETPGGRRLAHQPYVLDLDGDGRDEVVIGYHLLGPDGVVRWQAQAEEANLAAGHVDCCRVLRRGDRPEAWRLVMTCCTSRAMLCIDGNGRTVWERTGRHFESLDVGKIRHDVPGLQIIADDDHCAPGNSAVMVFDEAGRDLGEIRLHYGRHHDLLHWGPNGLAQLVLGDARALYDGHGRRQATLDVRASDGRVRAVRRCDLGGVEGLLLTTFNGRAAYLYADPSALSLKRTAPTGTGRNVSLY